MKRKFASGVALVAVLVAGTTYALAAWRRRRSRRSRRRVSVTGQRQGSFSSKRIPVIAVSHEIVSPRDAASDLPTGKRQHKPITTTKPIDASTPLFLNALTTNENLSEVVITYTRDGKDVFQVTLTNASLATYKSHENNEN